MIVKKEMNESGCLLSRGLLDLRLSLIPDGYRQLPRAGHTSGGSFALNYVGTEKTQGFSEEKILSTCVDFLKCF